MDTLFMTFISRKIYYSRDAFKNIANLNFLHRMVTK